MARIIVSEEAYKIADEWIQSDEELRSMIEEGYLARDDVAFFYFVELSTKDMIEQRTRDAKAKQFETRGPQLRKIYDPESPLVDVSDIDSGDDTALYQYVADKLGLTAEEVARRHFGYLVKRTNYKNKKMGEKPKDQLDSRNE